MPTRSYKREREELRRKAKEKRREAKELKRLADRAKLEESRLFELWQKGKKLPKKLTERGLEEIKRATFRNALERLERIQDMETKGNRVLEQIKEDARKEVEVPDVKGLPPKIALKKLEKPHKKLLELERRIKKWEKKEKARRKKEIKEKIVRERYEEVAKAFEKAREAERLYKVPPTKTKKYQKAYQKTVKKITPIREVTLEEKIEFPEKPPKTMEEASKLIGGIQKQLFLIQDRGGKPGREAFELIGEITKIVTEAKEKRRVPKIPKEILDRVERLRESMLPRYVTAVPASEIPKRRLNMFKELSRDLMQAESRGVVGREEGYKLRKELVEARSKNEPLDKEVIKRIKELGRLPPPPPPEEAVRPPTPAEREAKIAERREEIKEKRREMASEAGMMDLEKNLDKLLREEDFKNYTRQIKIEYEGEEISGLDFLQKAGMNVDLGVLTIDDLNKARDIINTWEREKRKR